MVTAWPNSTLVGSGLASARMCARGRWTRPIASTRVAHPSSSSRAARPVRSLLPMVSSCGVPAPSVHGGDYPAVDGDVRPGDAAGSVTGQEGDQIGDLLRGAEAAERRGLDGGVRDV